MAFCGVVGPLDSHERDWHGCLTLEDEEAGKD